MKTVKLLRGDYFKNEITSTTEEVYVPEGCYKEKIEDYQDPKPYYKYYYTSKSGNKKECNIEWVNSKGCK